MPFEKSDETLFAVIDQVIADNAQIREALDSARYDAQEIHEELSKDKERVWEVANNEIREYNSTEALYEGLHAQATKDAGTPPSPHSAQHRSDVPDWMNGVAGIYITILTGVSIYLLFHDWHGTLVRLWTVQGWLWIFAASVPLIVFGAAASWYARRFSRDEVLRQNKYQQLETDWKSKYQVLAARLNLDALKAALSAQRSTITDLLRQSVTRALTSAANQRTQPSYGFNLDITKPEGFGEVFDKRFTIDTESRLKLEFMLKSMPGGSIGIAGPRGAGKTTLLKMFCGPKRVIEKLNEKPVLGVLVSAPVAYEARDFILYLFSTVCQNVIEAEGGKYSFPGAPEETIADPFEAPVISIIRPLPGLAIKTGLILILFSLTLALGMAALKGKKPEVETKRAQPSTTGATAAPNSAANSTAPSLSTSQTPSASPAVPAKSQGSEVPGLLSRWIGELQPDSGTILEWGIILVLGGLAMARLLRMSPRRMFLVAIASLLNRTIGLLPIYGSLTKRFLELQIVQQHAEMNRFSMKNLKRMASDSPTPAAESLWGQADLWLKAIKFQQSYTSGWSGSLKLPLGLEGGVNRAVTLAQNQLSLPEVVHFLMRFLEKTSLKYQVIIGIDEMDKLASDAQAQQFLNDIKSIFGLERCFYLISVSEDAMSSFERRGLPFRDAFDSSFDDFVHVDHLQFQHAQKLLEQRVVGRPILFFAMSYCMSGGLPRDLIRNFRSVLEARERNSGKNDLSTICMDIVRRDLVAKAGAVRTSARKIHLEPDVDQFLEILYLLETSVSSDLDLTELARKLLAMTTMPPSNGDGVWRIPDKERSDKRDQLNDLGEELGTFILYALTLRQFFTNSLNYSSLGSNPSDHFNTLARARQLLGINPGITRTLLKTFRAATGMPSLI